MFYVVAMLPLNYKAEEVSRQRVLFIQPKH